MTEEIRLIPSDPDTTLEWITVLAAAGLDYRLSRGSEGWVLHIPSTQAERARNELDAYERDRLRGPLTQPPPDILPHDARAAWLAFWFAHMLVLFYMWWGAFDAGQPAHMAGCAQAGRIVSGEWWRTLTALTLHSGVPHLAGNVLFIALIGPALLKAFGAGMGLCMMLAGGMLGNGMAAFTANPMQIGVGASTMAFAALGSLSARRSIDAWRNPTPIRTAWPRTWIPFAAGIALLAFLGSAPHSDLGAHLFGFAAGALIAVPGALLHPRRLSKAVDWLLIATAFSVPVMAWLIALRTLA